MLEYDVLQDSAVDFERHGTVQGGISLGLPFAVSMLNIPVPFEGGCGRGFIDVASILIFGAHLQSST
jgi:hypothetical protein